MKRVSVATGAALAFLALSGAPARADEFYVAPDGSDQAAGTLAAPFATVERAQTAAAPGDTVYIRGGEYRFSGTSATAGVTFTKSGQSGKPIRYFAYADEVPIFDLFDLKPQARVTGLDVRCSWIHIRGLEVRGVQQEIVGDSWGVRIRGDHNVIEALNVHHCEAPGIFITSGGSNLILNCDSHHNYDPLESGENADGFGCHSTGGDNVLRGCRGYSNSDDGFDFINAPGTCTVERSWAFRNGFVPDTTTPSGNGAGFKAGGFGSPPKIPATGVPRHVVSQNLSFRNRSQGFYANHHPGGLDFLNNTAFDNPVNFDMLVEGGPSTHELHNNLAVSPGTAVARWSGGDDGSNSWTLAVSVSADDFAGMDPAAATAPRNADGSLPAIEFMHLRAGSDLIDKGQDVGLSFTGAAPDLGAFEFGEEPDSGGSEPQDAGVPDVGAQLQDASTTTPGGDAGQAGDAGTMGTAGTAGTAGTNGGPTTPPVTAGTSAATPTAGASPAAQAGASAAPPVTGPAPTPAPRSASTDGCRVATGRHATRRVTAGAWLVLGCCLGLTARRRYRSRAAARSNAGI